MVVVVVAGGSGAVDNALGGPSLRVSAGFTFYFNQTCVGKKKCTHLGPMSKAMGASPKHTKPQEDE